jgi:RNA polymerase sigma factor (sigma-70 family)
MLGTSSARTSVVNAWAVKTPWTVLLSAREQHAAGMEQLLSLYSDPIYAYYRRQGLTPSDAEDLTQHMLMEFFLVKKSHETVSPTRGRFRDFLLASARNALLDWRKHGRAQRRGGDRKCFSLDELKEQWAHWEPADSDSPEAEFERQWARSTWLAALELFRARNSPELVEALDAFYAGGDRPTQEQAAAQLGVSVACLNSRLYTARRRLFECIQEIVRATIEDPRDLGRELNWLRDMLAEAGM